MINIFDELISRKRQTSDHVYLLQINIHVDNIYFMTNLENDSEYMRFIGLRLVWRIINTSIAPPPPQVKGM